MNYWTHKKHILGKLSVNWVLIESESYVSSGQSSSVSDNIIFEEFLDIRYFHIQFSIFTCFFHLQCNTQPSGDVAKHRDMKTNVKRCRINCRTPFQSDYS